MNGFGLRDGDLEIIRRAVAAYPAIDEARIFGSRAKGTFRPGSDVDLAILGAAVDWSTVAALKAELEERGPLPYRFDIVDYTHLDHNGLRGHIDRVGAIIWRRAEYLNSPG